MLSEIDLLMPNYQGSSKVEMAKVDSLSKYLENSGAEINQDAIDELTKLPEEISGTPTEFNYRAIGKEKETK